MRHVRVQDPAELIVAWEAVEELLEAVPEGAARDVLRLVAAGWPAESIASRLGLAVGEVETLAARGRIRILTAAAAIERDPPSGRRGGPAGPA